MAETKPIEDMLKAELVVEVRARIAEVQMLKELIQVMGATPAQPVQTKKRWAVYDRGTV